MNRGIFTFLRVWALLLAAVGVAATLAGLPILGLMLLGLGVLAWVFQGDRVQRWLAGREVRSIVGGEIEVRLGDDGLRFRTPLGEGSAPWSAVTALRENERTVIFMRDRIAVAYIPSSAFRSAEQRAEIVAFVQRHVVNANMAIGQVPEGVKFKKVGEDDE